MSECSLLGWLTLIVLFLTGAVVTWYTVETWRLRRQAQLQTELQTRPFLSIASEGRESGIYIVNLGQRLARNISIDTIRIGDGFELSSPTAYPHRPGRPSGASLAREVPSPRRWGDGRSSRPGSPGGRRTHPYERRVQLIRDAYLFLDRRPAISHIVGGTARCPGNRDRG